MKIDELEANSKVINLVATLSNLGEATQTPRGKDVQEGVLSDETGQVKVTLWDEQVTSFKLNEKLKIVTGWCKEFEGKLGVSSGKFGKIEVPSFVVWIGLLSGNTISFRIEQ